MEAVVKLEQGLSFVQQMSTTHTGRDAPAALAVQTWSTHRLSTVRVPVSGTRAKIPRCPRR